MIALEFIDAIIRSITVIIVWELMKYIEYKFTHYRIVDKEGCRITTNNKNYTHKGYKRLKWHQWWKK